MNNSSDLGRQARDAAADLGQQAKETIKTGARQHVEAARDTAAHHVQTAADAAEAAADTLGTGSMQANAVRHVADRIEGIAHSLRTTDIETSLRDVTAFARENPVVFVAGSALLGFVAARFLKARDPRSSRTYASDDDPWATPSQPGSTYDTPVSQPNGGLGHARS